jgi:histidinol phosphatase-like enzyme
MKRFGIFDIDWTLLEYAKKFPESIYDGTMADHAPKILEKSQSEGYTCVGLSNQAGIWYGFHEESWVVARMYRILQRFPHLEAIYFCPDKGETLIKVSRGGRTTEIRSPKGGFRKPGTKFVGVLESDYDCICDRKNSFIMGDMDSDLVQAHIFEMKFISAARPLDSHTNTTN